MHRLREGWFRSQRNVILRRAAPKNPYEAAIFMKDHRDSSLPEPALSIVEVVAQNDISTN